MVSWRVPRGGFSGRSVWQRLAFHQVDWVCPTESDFPHRLDRGKSPTPMESLTSASGCGHNLRANGGIFE